MALSDMPIDCTTDHTWSASWPCRKALSKANSRMIATIQNRRVIRELWMTALSAELITPRQIGF